MDPLLELSHLKFTGKTDGRRHVAKFEKLVSNAYPHATDTAKWSLFIKTMDTSQRSTGPSEWLREISKTEMWKSGRFSYQQLRSSFLDRWSRSHRSESAALVPMTIHVNTNRRERPDSHSRERRASEREVVYQKELARRNTEKEYHRSGEKEYHQTKESNQIVLTFPGPGPDLKKRRKVTSFHSITPDQPNPLLPSNNGYNPMEPLYIPDSPRSRDHVSMTRDVVIVDADRGRGSSYHSSPHGSVRDSPEPELAPNPRRLLENKVCLITGANSEIGQTLARGFALEGAHLMLQYNGGPADPANDEIVSLCVEIRQSGQGCNVISGDLADPKTSDLIVKRCLDVYGKIDIMVGNIEMAIDQDFLNATPESFQRSNDNGTFLLCQAVARQMSTQAAATPRNEPKPDHSIVCIASASSLSGLQQLSQLAPTRAAVVSLMQQCAASLGKYGVRCNTILPGPMDISDPRAERDAIDRVPLGRMGTPEDLVGPAVFLASSMSRYVSGTQVIVDGGAFVHS